jgi:hypothetical protein
MELNWRLLAVKNSAKQRRIENTDAFTKASAGGGERGGVGTSENEQFQTVYNSDRPVGVALWALADDLVAGRIDAGDTRMAAVEWKNGSNMRIIDVVAPFGGEAEMREQLSDARG